MHMKDYVLVLAGISCAVAVLIGIGYLKCKLNMALDREARKLKGEGDDHDK